MSDTESELRTKKESPYMKHLGDEQVEQIAAACHEVNRRWCILSGDDSQASWEDAPEWQRESAMAGVYGVIGGNGPEQSHESWLAVKEADGWVYGDVKDPEAKTHPCMVPYEDLPPHQHYKDSLFVQTARSMAEGMAFDG